MERFLLLLLGTNDYITVLIGFMFAFLGMASSYLFSNKKLTFDVMIKNILAIIIVMRFSKMIIDLIPMHNVAKDDIIAYIGIIVGFMCEAIPTIIMKKVNLLKSKITKSDSKS